MKVELIVPTCHLSRSDRPVTPPVNQKAQSVHGRSLRTSTFCCYTPSRPPPTPTSIWITAQPLPPPAPLPPLCPGPSPPPPRVSLAKGRESGGRKGAEPGSEPPSHKLKQHQHLNNQAPPGRDAAAPDQRTAETKVRPRASSSEDPVLFVNKLK